MVFMVLEDLDSDINYEDRENLSKKINSTYFIVTKYG